MKKTYLLTTLFLAFCLASNAQSPDYEWGRQFTGKTGSNAIATSNWGDVYSVGTFFGDADFDPEAGETILTAEQFSDVFITKLSATGSLTWAKQLIGDSTLYASGVETDALGNLYVFGQFRGTADFDPGMGVFELHATGVSAFIVKLNVLGNFVWAAQLVSTNSGGASINSLAIDPSGNLYIGGDFARSVDVDPGPGTAILTSTNPNGRAFIGCLSAQGNYVWGKEVSDDNDSDVRLAALDLADNGNILITGAFYGDAYFDPSSPTPTSAINRDCFVCNYSPNGSFVWAKMLTGSGIHSMFDMEVDYEGNIILSGESDGPMDFDPSIEGIELAPATTAQEFICKWDSYGNFVWVRMLNGDQTVSESISTDAAGSIYVIGYYLQTVDFDPSESVFELSTGGIYARFLFVWKISSFGNFSWVVDMRRTTNQPPAGYDIDVDQSGNIYSTFVLDCEMDVDPSSGTATFDVINNDNDRNAFVHKMSNEMLEVPTSKMTEFVRLFPNPASDFVSVEVSEESTVELIGFDGQVIQSTSGSSTIQLDLSAMPSGSYLIQTSNSKGSTQHKIVRQ